LTLTLDAAALSCKLRIHVVSHSSLGSKKIQYYTRLHAKNLTINTTLSYNIQYIVAEIHASVSSAAEGFLRGFSHFSQSAFNELTYHFSAQLRKLYYFKSIMNPVAIYHFFKKYFFICFVVYDQMAISREGGRRKVAKKTLASRFQCCKEYSQFAPYLAFSILAFFKGIRISIPQL